MNDTYGYVLQDGERLVTSSETLCLLVYAGADPVKVIYPSGRVEPYTGGTVRARDKRARAAA